RRRRCRALHDAARGDARSGRALDRGDSVSETEIRVHDLGDFEAVDVIEVHVAAGDRIEKDDPLITLETDKATMDVPAPDAGVVVDVRVSVGDKVSTGDPIVTLDAADAADAWPEVPDTPYEKAVPGTDFERKAPGTNFEGAEQEARGPASGTAAPKAETAHAGPAAAGGGAGTRIVVLGAGPGGYTAAFRAADLGLDVTLIERWPSLGGVCLNVGCIPSKALLHAARVIEEAKEMAAHGIDFGRPHVDTGQRRGRKNSVVR